MRRALLPSLLLLTAIVAVDARADCGIDDPAVVWSSPADGDVDVPVDTKLWIVPSFANTPIAVTVDDVALDVAAVERVGNALVFAVESLGADSDHVVDIAFDDVNAPDGEADVVERIAFRTGSASVGVPAAPRLASVVGTTTRALSDECRAVLDATGCYDEGQDTHVVGAVDAADDTIGWLVTPTDAQGRTTGGPVFWPATCGDPEYFDVARAVAACMSVQAVNAAGVSTSSNNRCEGATDNVIGCSTSSPASLEFTSTAAALGVLLRRRRWGRQ